MLKNEAKAINYHEKITLFVKYFTITKIVIFFSDVSLFCRQGNKVLLVVDTR
jgi:hypothetical protein